MKKLIRNTLSNELIGSNPILELVGVSDASIYHAVCKSPPFTQSVCADINKPAATNRTTQRSNNHVNITKEMVEDFITDGAASAMNSAKDDAAKIAAQMSAELATNKSKTSTNTLSMSITIKVKAEERKVEIEGAYGFKVPNLGNTAPKIIRELENPDQPELGFEQPVFDNDQDLTGKNPPEPDEQKE